MIRSRWVLAMAISLTLLSAACKRHGGNGEEGSSGTEPRASTLPPLTLKDDTPELLLTWVDKKGDAHTVSQPSEVPIEGRDQVRVVVTTKDDGTHELFYVANLALKNGDGTYPVSTMTRSEWDALLSARRQALIASAMPPPPAPPGSGAPQAPPAAPTEGPVDPGQHAITFTVIVYGASWCGACHEAVAHLKRRHIPVVEKDIEADEGAAAEMHKKLARAGQRGGSIPVIDVNGKILIGFESHALDAAVRAAAGGVAL